MMKKHTPGEAAEVKSKGEGNETKAGGSQRGRLECSLWRKSFAVGLGGWAQVTPPTVIRESIGAKGTTQHWYLEKICNDFASCYTTH